MKKRHDRYDSIREIIRTKHIRTQRDLVAELRSRGFDCTQATVSRDIADMGLQKLPEGVYMLAEDLHMQRMVSGLVLKVAISGNFVVVKTATGTAQGVAAALDGANMPTVLGSIAGDDTILVITQNEDSAKEFESLIRKLKLK